MAATRELITHTSLYKNICDHRNVAKSKVNDSVQSSSAMLYRRVVQSRQNVSSLGFVPLFTSLANVHGLHLGSLAKINSLQTLLLQGLLDDSAINNKRRPAILFPDGKLGRL